MSDEILYDVELKPGEALSLPKKRGRNYWPWALAHFH